MGALARLLLVLFHVGGGLVVLEGLFLLLSSVSLVFLCRWLETRTSPVLNAVFVSQIRVFYVELVER